MAEVSSRFLPVSHLVNGVRTPGLICNWPSLCNRCDRQCVTSTRKDLAVCSYGVNYFRAAPDLLLFGFIVQTASASQSQKRALKQFPSSAIRPELFRETINILDAESKIFKDSREAALKQAVAEYRADAMYKTDLLESLKPEIRRNLAFLHDYKQFVASVKQNINVVLQTRFPGDSLDYQLQKASKEEAAIYWAAALMEDKLQTALLLTQPERLSGAPRTEFRLHGLILKHIRIYSSSFDSKGVTVQQKGHSEGTITASQAFAVIPHALLDNALKYSSRGCQVFAGFEEDSEFICFSVTSFGPKIEPNEMGKIFELFQRGAAGVAFKEEGSGIGLYLAQFVARELGTEITVRQSSQKTKCGYETIFSVRLPRTS